MVLWHAGTAAALTYVTLGRRRIDYRFVLAGALLPDLIDAAVRPWMGAPTGRYFGHSLIAVIAVALAVTAAFSGERRLAVFGVAVGWLLHLVGDGMWTAPRTFLWPAFGTSFAAGSAEPYSWDLLVNPTNHLSTWAAEAIGALLLVWFYVAFRLGRDGRLGRFLQDGYLRP